MLEDLHRTESYWKGALLFETGVFMNGLFDEVSVEKAWISCTFMFLFLFYSVMPCRKEFLL